MAKLRSNKFFYGSERINFLRRALFKSMGFSDYDMNRPLIAIVNTYSELNPGHFHLKQIADAVKRGILSSGGFPIEVNTISMCEVFFEDSTLMYRNLLAMETEELVRSQPFDGAVFISTCDKVVPAQLMACASANIPSIFALGGSMLPCVYKGEDLAFGTDGTKIWNEYRIGNIDNKELGRIEDKAYPTIGACGMMGTANTMQSLVEALGMTLPGTANTPAVYSKRYRDSEEVGRKIVDLVKKKILPSDIMTRDSVLNAAKVLMALGGSTNAIIHLLALSKRLKVNLSLKDFDRISREIPVICNLKPNGKYVILDFYNTGGTKKVLKNLGMNLNTSVLTSTGKTLSENLKNTESVNNDVIRSVENPIFNEGGIAVLQGNICPDGAIIKQSAASKELLVHEGKAVVYESYKDGIKSAKKDRRIDKDSIVILRNEGPIGAPGMPEVGGWFPIPDHLLKKGVKDIVRITDSRMSGSCFGTIVLHITPESAIGGPLGIIEDGDLIKLDINKRSLNLLISESVLKNRLDIYTKKIEKKKSTVKRGFIKMYIDNVEQANKGCDFKFM